MLYLDYSRKSGRVDPQPLRRPGEPGAPSSFLRRLNAEVYGLYPDVQTIAEESTAWPMVSKPTYVGGLGFGLKWDMGWMHDTLAYFAHDPIYRRYHHNELTFRSLYAFTENFVLPLSHDEVVHGKGSLLGKMPGDDWQKFANLRLLYAYMYAQPGKKLLFMGAEFGQWREWDHDGSLDWHLAQYGRHAGIGRAAGRPQPPLPGASRRSTSWTWRRAASSGSTPATATRACCSSCVAAWMGGRCWWPSTSRRSCDGTTGWARPWAGSGRKCSTPTPRTTEAAARATWAASRPSREAATAVRTA